MERDEATISRQQALVVIVVEKASDAERLALSAWATQLLKIRDSDVSSLAKARAAVALTLSAKVVWPAARITASKIKEFGWDNRSRSARFGMGGAALGIAFFGTHGAGIAAFGTAIGVPLWVVLGAGAAFANGLIEEVQRRKNDGE